VFDVLLADLLHVLVLLQVVVTVGKGDTALGDDTDLQCGVLLILLGAEAIEEACAVFVFEITDESGKLCLVVPIGDLFENGCDRLGAELVGKVGVHAGSKVVAVLRLKRRLWSVGCCLQVLIEEITVTLGEFVEAAPTYLIGGYGVVLLPVTARVLIEVGAWIGCLVDAGEVHADGLRWGRCRAGGCVDGSGEIDLLTVTEGAADKQS